MLFKNDIYAEEGIRHRLLYVEAKKNIAWVINMDDSKAWPIQRHWNTIASLSSLSNFDDTNKTDEKPTEQRARSESITSTDSRRKSRDRALKILGELPNQVPDIFYPELRGQLVSAREKEGFSRSAIYKNLRRYWVGGQTPAALLGNFQLCGRTEHGVTARRGAKPRFGHDTYQLTPPDIEAFKDVIERLYLKDGRLKITHAFQRLLEEHYQTADGNGELWIRPQGERPSLKQFEYFLRTTYPLEQRLRKREGNKDFERDHRAILDSVLSRCQGVGHQYEADATIADVYLVAKDDRRKIIGKPTIYFIIDRRSRLIVGWYVGLENSSWVCAMQALLTISMDKQAICERYAVKYEPADWPAHQVFPSELIADRELLQRASDQIADDLVTRVVNLPSQRPDHKPIVETQFKLTRMRLQDGTPGMDPPENAKRRMGRHYEKDACLTLDEFVAIILLAIIEHNRTPSKEYELSLTELTDEVNPSPIAIWNHNIVSRAGMLTRYPEERVRLALLPRAQATVSEQGIAFGGCYYTCPEAIDRGWFVSARRRRFKVEVSYDGRLVDTIYVRHSDRSGQRIGVFACTLTARSARFQGLSFAEVKAYEHFRDSMTPAIDQARIQARADYHAATKPIIDNARKELKSAGPMKARTARRAAIKGDRLNELKKERQEIAAEPINSHDVENDSPNIHETNISQLSTERRGLVPTSDTSTSSSGRVVPLRLARPELSTSVPSVIPTRQAAGDSIQPTEPSVIHTDNPRLSLAEKARLMRERMRHG